MLKEYKHSDTELIEFEKNINIFKYLPFINNENVTILSEQNRKICEWNWFNIIVVENSYL